MQPIKRLTAVLDTIADEGHYIFNVADFVPIFADISIASLRNLFSRAVKCGLLVRMCRNVYLYPKVKYRRGFELYHVAARLRENALCYLTMESVLSEAGFISQLPLGHITLMTNGRSGVISCGVWGNIEFIHTKRSIESLANDLTYDARYGLWRANESLAIKDMQFAKRPTMELVNEYV
ncbi:hypothetical protein RsTz2092_00610 [Deferribacterales bacterium RsTz2092]